LKDNKQKDEAYDISLKDIVQLKKDIEIKDEEIQNLIELAFEEGKLPKKPKPKRAFVTAMIRIEIAASQSWCCHLCEKMLQAYFDIDHTIPLWNDGEDILENLTALCIPCHAEKTHNERKLRRDMLYLNTLK
jgi:5-methylcytosine-specific restriction endonuclease McrA